MKAQSILVEDFIRGLPEQQVKKGQFNGCIVREIEDPVIVGQIMQLCQHKKTFTQTWNFSAADLVPENEFCFA